MKVDYLITNGKGVNAGHRHLLYPIFTVTQPF